MQSGAAAMIRSFEELDQSTEYGQQFVGLLQMRLE
jgi:hypothetical protein